MMFRYNITQNIIIYVERLIGVFQLVKGLQRERQTTSVMNIRVLARKK